MQKHAIIVHGWGGDPGEGWFPWIKAELEKQDFRVDVPAMPETKTPKIEPWVAYLAEVVGTANSETYLIGHSIGCQTIVRYLETLPDDVRVGGVILVAPWLELITLDEDDDEAVVRPWIETPIDYEKVKQRSDSIVAIFSDDDPFVPLANIGLFQKRLDASTELLHNQGHFSGSDGVTELPIVLDKLIEMSKR